MTLTRNPLFNSEPTQAVKFNSDGYKRFIHDNYTIINKDKTEVVFDPNPPQDDLLKWMRLYHNILILKARKMGFSSIALAVACTKFITGINERCVSMSFDATASGKQLERAKHFIKSYEEINKVKIPLKYNTKSEMVFEGIGDDGRRYTNALRVGTAKSTSFGRGDDITFLHLTEVAFCDDIEVLMAGVGEACVRGAHKLLETTANGFNSYKSFWDGSVKNEKGFAALFYDPTWEYSTEYLAEKAKNLGRLMYQEYPMSPQEAFIASGDQYFDKLSLKEMLDEVERWERIYQKVTTNPV